MGAAVVLMKNLDALQIQEIISYMYHADHKNCLIIIISSVALPLIN